MKRIISSNISLLSIQLFYRATIDKLNRELDQEKVFQYKVLFVYKVRCSSLMHVHVWLCPLFY